MSRLHKIIIILEKSKRQLRRQIAAIRLRAQEEGRELSIDEQLKIEALINKRNSERKLQLQQARKLYQMRMRSMRKFSKVAAVMLLILLPFTWMMIPPNSENEGIVKKPIPSKNPIEVPEKEMPSISSIEPPSSKPIPQLLAKVEIKPVVTLANRIGTYRDAKDKKLAILDSEEVFSLWNKNEQDTLEFFLFDAQMDTVYTKPLTYLHSVTFSKKDLPGLEKEGYHYLVLDKDFQDIDQGQVSITPKPDQKE